MQSFGRVAECGCHHVNKEQKYGWIASPHKLNWRHDSVPQIFQPVINFGKAPNAIKL